MRINKYLSTLGVCSRREADKLIQEQKVLINGKPATLGTQVTEKDKISINGRPIASSMPQKIYIAFHKPYGVITTTDKSKPNNILEYINLPERVFPVGRLDVLSSGLILLTNDGDIVNNLMRAENKKEKEYFATLDKPMTPQDIKKLEKGITIIKKNSSQKRVPQKTLPAIIKKISPNQLSITIIQGLNRQIRRMCEALGYEVKILKRIRIASIELGELPRGKWRILTPAEIASIKN
jgi:23S rRNA pseudouridine2604 synthase